MEDPNTDEDWLYFMSNNYLPTGNLDEENLVEMMEPWIEEMDIEDLNKDLEDYIKKMNNEIDMAGDDYNILNNLKNHIVNNLNCVSNKYRPFRFTTMKLIKKLEKLINKKMHTPPKTGLDGSLPNTPPYTPAISLSVTPIAFDISLGGRGENRDRLIEEMSRFEPSKYAKMPPFERPLLNDLEQRQTSIYGLNLEGERERLMLISKLQKLIKGGKMGEARNFLFEISERYGMDYAIGIERGCKKD